MRLHLPLLTAVGLFGLSTFAPAQSPAPAATPAAEASPAPSPTKRQRHKKADPAAPATTPAAASGPADSPAGPSATPAKKTKEERQAANKARLDKLAAMTPAPGGGPGMVWVNSESKAYHDQNSPYYGKTKHGKYVTEEAAKAEGDHPAGQRVKHAAKS